MSFFGQHALIAAVLIEEQVRPQGWPEGMPLWLAIGYFLLFAVAFIVQKWEGKPRADGIEGSMIRFFSLSKMPDNIVSIHMQTIKDYAGYDGKFIW